MGAYVYLTRYEKARMAARALDKPKYFKSDFTVDYLNKNKTCGIGEGYTPSSYVHLLYQHGNMQTANAIIKDIENNPHVAFKYFSRGNKVAYYYTSMLDEDRNKKYKTIVALLKLVPTLSRRELEIKEGLG